MLINKEQTASVALGVLIGLVGFLLLLALIIYIWIHFFTSNPGLKTDNNDEESLEDIEDLFDDV